MNPEDRKFRIIEVNLTKNRELELKHPDTKAPVTRIELAKGDILVMEAVNRLKEGPIPSILRVYPIVGGKPWPSGLKWAIGGKTDAIPGLCVTERGHRLFIGNALPGEDITYKFDYEMVIRREIGAAERFVVDPELVIKKGVGGVPPCDSFRAAVDQYRP